MLNTCSIGRRWKPREGWSRPVLTGERGTLFPTRLLGRVSSCGGFFRWMARSIVSCGHGNDTGEAFLLASVVRFPDRHDRNRGTVPVLPADPCGWPLYWFCGGHGPGETPGPIPNPEAKAWHGDGTAPDRVWESSTPPHHTYRKPLGAHAPRGFRIPETLTTQTHTPPQKHPGLLACPDTNMFVFN